MTDEEKKLLTELNQTNYGKALKKFLDIEMERLKDVTNAKSWDDTLGRQKAVEIINKLFTFIGDKKPVVENKRSYE